MATLLQEEHTILERKRPSIGEGPRPLVVLSPTLGGSTTTAERDKLNTELAGLGVYFKTIEQTEYRYSCVPMSRFMR